jgi:predicted nucleotidyltransferase
MTKLAQSPTPLALDLVRERCVHLAQTLFASEPKLRIVLFGSRARDTHGPRSDFDIGIEAGRPLPLADLSLAREAMEALPMLETVDLVDLAAVDDDFRREAERSIVVLYER